MLVVSFAALAERLFAHEEVSSQPPRDPVSEPKYIFMGIAVNILCVRVRAKEKQLESNMADACTQPQGGMQPSHQQHKNAPKHECDKIICASK